MNCKKPIQIAVVSGKGGTGKTTVVGSFANLLSNKVIADCDVDAANLHLLLKPKVRKQEDFLGAKIAVRDVEKCIHCGAAELRCRFDAIIDEKINEFSCEGCGLCVLVCPTNALRLESIKCGEFYISDTRYGPMVHAKLYPGGESSGRLVTIVRQHAENIALSEGREFIIIDGPPGIGCTATASLADVSLALVVTEPTLSGIHDMQRVIQLIKHFGCKSAVIINKFDLNLENRENIRSLCKQFSVPIVGEIPFDDIVTNAIAAAVPLVEFSTGPAASAMTKTWENVMSLIN